MSANAQQSFEKMSNEQVAPMLRSEQFAGSRGTWSKRSAHGDWAIVNLQKSRWNTSDRVAFTVNLSVVPEPWFAWQAKQYGFASTKKPREENGLWRDRLHPSAGLSEDGQFWVVSDAATALACGEDVIGQLQNFGIPHLLKLLDREALMDAIRAEDFGYMKMSRLIPLVVMLSESGPSEELDQAISSLESNLPGFRDWKLKGEFVTWARERAALRRSDPGG